MMTVLLVAVGYVFGMFIVGLLRRKYKIFKKVDYVEIEELTNLHKKFKFAFGPRIKFKYTTVDIGDNNRIEIRSTIDGIQYEWLSIKDANEVVDKACINKQKELEAQVETGQNLLA